MLRPPLMFHHPRCFLYVVVSILMSAYDAVATMQHIGRGVAAEGNPLMESLIEQNALLFFFVKMAITAVCLLVCYRFSHLRTARFGLRLVVVMYAIVCTYHVMILALGS